MSSRSLIRHSTALSYFGAYFSANVAIAVFRWLDPAPARFRAGLCALGCMDFGNLSRRSTSCAASNVGDASKGRSRRERTDHCYLAIIDDPTRFKRSRSVGAYVGLTSRRYASGEVDWTGRISKCGDAMLRSYLYEAAGVLLTRVAKWSVLKAWGMRVSKRSGLRKAQSRGCSKARRDFASHVGRRHRVQMVIEGGCHSTCITAYHVIEFPLTSGRRRPCRDGGGGEIAPGFAMLKRAKRASHIDPPASS